MILKAQNAEVHGLEDVPVTKVLICESLEFLTDDSFGFV